MNYTLWLRHVRSGEWNATRETKHCESQTAAEQWAARTVEDYQLSAMLYIALPEGEHPNPYS